MLTVLSGHRCAMQVGNDWNWRCCTISYATPLLLSPEKKVLLHLSKHKHSSQWTTASSCGSGPGRDRHKIILDPAWHFQARATFKEKHHIVSYTRVTPGPLLRNSQWNRSRALSPQRRIISVRSRHACVTIGSNWLLQTTKQSLDYNVTLNRSFACVKQM